MTTLITAAIDKHRLAGLQDGVYSIAMTLLVLELKLPAFPEPFSDAAVWAALLAIWPKLLTWLLSFWVLAVFWIGDSRALSVYAAVNGFLLRLGLCRLALVSLLPFSTALIGEHGDHAPAAAVYAAHLFCLAAVQTARHLYLQKNPSIATWSDAKSAANDGARAYATLACTAVAFALAFVVPGYNMFALLPIVALSLFRRFNAASTGGHAA
jgi:TMEM175 potassium channel family protein